MTDGVVKIHGREYKTVALRVAEFKERHAEWSIVTELVSANDEAVVMKALVMDDVTLLPNETTFTIAILA